MAKTSMYEKPECYEFIRAIVEDGDSLRWEYRLDRKGAPVSGMSHDEDVTGWTDEDIKHCTRQMLDVDPDDPVEIEVEYH